MKRKSFNIGSLLTATLIIAIIFKNKFIYIAPNLNVSIYTFIYPFTFLFVGIILTMFTYRDAKTSIRSSIIVTLLFYLVVTILCNIPANNNSIVAGAYLQKIFVPNSIFILGRYFYYIDLSIIFILGIYYLTHNIFISIKDLLTLYTNKYLSFSIAVFMASIIDTMFIVPVLHSKDIFYSNIESFGAVKFLTSNFMVLIITSLTLILLYTLMVFKKEN